MKRGLSAADLAIWEAVARQVRPLKGRGLPALPAVARPAPVAQPPAALAPATVRRPPPTAALEIGRRLSGLDDTSWRALASGRLRPQRTLDLHGRTAEHAFHALHGFLLRARSERLRCVEIITGVGSGAQGGILRRELPHWLSRPDLRGLVLAAVHPHPGNPGAVRVLLRRRNVGG